MASRRHALRSRRRPSRCILRQLGRHAQPLDIRAPSSRPPLFATAAAPAAPRSFPPSRLARIRRACHSSVRRHSCRRRCARLPTSASPRTCTLWARSARSATTSRSRARSTGTVVEMEVRKRVASARSTAATICSATRASSNGSPSARTRVRCASAPHTSSSAVVAAQTHLAAGHGSSSMRTSRFLSLIHI